VNREDVIACIRHDIAAIAGDSGSTAAAEVARLADDGPDWLSVAALMMEHIAWPTIARPSARAAIGAALSLADDQTDEAAATLAALYDMDVPGWLAATLSEVSR
jgi:hypothetical protein